ncbi:MAG: hypothetical protein IJM50_02760 [Lachnospiraceae bacterium]|nr:hypothetical protein [Lachnospiraceae bacterium]
MNKKRFFTDFIYGIIGLAVMNAILSLLVYPVIERRLGIELQGRVLFFMSMAQLIAGSLGSAANYGRMKIHSTERHTVNGESNIFLLIAAAITVIVTIAAILIKKDRADATVFGIMAVIFATTVRMYADVEYRLSLNYKRFAVYYLLIGLGYGLGLLLFLLTGRWVLVFLTGELFGILFVALTGTIFRKPFFERTQRWKTHLATDGKLAVSYFLSDLVGVSDRLLFPLLLTNGDTFTSLYYYASLVGKITSLLSTPLNGVLSGYIAKKEEGIDRKTFLKIIAFLAGVFLAITAAAVGGSYLFVYLFYRSHFETVKGLFVIANAGQVLFFICNTLMVIVLRYTHERNQLIVNVIYILLFFGVTVPMILHFGLQGMAWGLLIVNGLKFLTYAAVGCFSIPAGRKEA